MTDTPRTALGWLPAGATTLAGNNSHTYTDVNDDDAAQPDEEVPADATGNWNYPFTPFALDPSFGCSASFPCGWDPDTPFSWQVNRKQGSTQVFTYVNLFHDHLAAAPIGFTEAAGNFQDVNASGQGLGGDAVDTQNDDGANTALDAQGNPIGLPDGNHVDNANMGTPADGQAPVMQMYLVHQPGTTADEDPYLPVQGGDDALTVYHEYTHGLSNRLVVDALGNSTLGNFQAGAMGEAWSDWYAFDKLVGDGFLTDTAVPGELNLDVYWAPGKVGVTRTESIDCPVGVVSDFCPNGGYTYGAYGQIFGVPEVHADGEIWAQTLWDLRGALGQSLAESLVTRAMELSPSNPSFLDERNAILQADLVVNGGAAHDAIWQVFANRGMGFFAAAANGDDTHPVEDFSLPPAANGPKATLVGQITDVQTGRPIRGAVVAFGGHASGFADDLAGATGRFGLYAIRGIPFGTYPGVAAGAAGYDTQTVTVTADRRLLARSFRLVRDWAAGPGGASVTAFDGPDFTPFGCGPDKAIDQTGNGWGSTTDLVGGAATPKSITIRLPRDIDVTSFGVNPSNTCGDGGSASTGGYRLETSRDGRRWSVASEGTFTAANRNTLNILAPSGRSGRGVRYVRFWMLTPQVPGGTAASCPGAFSGCDFMDMTELEVYGSPARGRDR